MGSNPTVSSSLSGVMDKHAVGQGPPPLPRKRRFDSSLKPRKVCHLVRYTALKAAGRKPWGFDSLTFLQSV